MFTDVDEELVVGLAAAAGVADRERPAAPARAGGLAARGARAHRPRPARHVIQRLFATGLTLQSTAQLCHPASGRPSGLTQVVDDLDVTVQQVRNAIFQLSHAGGRLAPACARDVMRDLLRGGRRARLRADVPHPRAGRLVVADDVAAHLVLPARGAVERRPSRHARPPTVRLTADGGRVGARGRRRRRRHRRRRLGRRARAGQHGRAGDAVGGTFIVEPADPTGTIVTWSRRPCTRCSRRDRTATGPGRGDAATGHGVWFDDAPGLTVAAHERVGVEPGLRADARQAAAHEHAPSSVTSGVDAVDLERDELPGVVDHVPGRVRMAITGAPSSLDSTKLTGSTTGYPSCTTAIRPTVHAASSSRHSAGVNGCGSGRAGLHTTMMRRSERPSVGPSVPVRPSPWRDQR